MRNLCIMILGPQDEKNKYLFCDSASHWFARAMRWLVLRWDIQLLQQSFISCKKFALPLTASTCLLCTAFFMIKKKRAIENYSVLFLSKIVKVKDNASRDLIIEKSLSNCFVNFSSFTARCRFLSFSKVFPTFRFDQPYFFYYLRKWFLPTRDRTGDLLRPVKRTNNSATVNLFFSILLAYFFF